MIKDMLIASFIGLIGLGIFCLIAFLLLKFPVLMCIFVGLILTAFIILLGIIICAFIEFMKGDL